MSSRITRSRGARSDTLQSNVTDFFKTTRKPRVRSEKKIIEESISINDATAVTSIKEEESVNNVKDNTCIAPIFEKKTSRARERTPSRQVEQYTREVTGTPPKKSRETYEAPVLPPEDAAVVLQDTTSEKSALDILIEASGPSKKKVGIRTVADLQARLAEKGAARAVHEQNVKNKAKQVDKQAEMIKSPIKKILESKSPKKTKTARSLFSPKKVPHYVVPGFNVQKSTEKILEEEESAHEEEGKRMTAEFMKTSKLIDEVKESARERIELPSAYEHLADCFKRVDQITAIFLGQNRSCTAYEVFKNVKNTSGTDFSDEHLSQILHVYPQSYHVKMREQRKAFGQGGKYELEIIPNLVDDLRGYVCDKSTSEFTEELPLVYPSKLLSPKKSPRKHAQAAPRKPELVSRTRLDAARQRDRALIFRHKLTVIVRNHHAEFLESQGLPNVKNIKRMHPLFCVNKHCPPLPLAKLPEPPVQKCSTHVGMKEALDKYMDAGLATLPSFVQKTFDDLKSPDKATTGSSGTVPVSPKKFSEMQKEQKKSGTLSLLERIREKEAIRKAADACIDQNLEKRKLRLMLLKDRYVRIVCNHYTAKRAQTMEMDLIAKFVQFSSSTSSSIPDITDHLKLMCEVAPMYLSEAIFMGKKYLRFIDNNMEAINELIAEELVKIQHKIDDQRSSQIAQMGHTPRPSKAARSLKFH